MTEIQTKTRFCPSPTGAIHLGNMRTALFSALYAASQKGAFLLRIEDTDAERSEQRHQASMMADLRWLGLQWDEGPEVEGDAGPYLQSERQAIYDSYYETLLANDQAYPCFCTDAELASARKAQLAAKRPPKYAGTCAHLTAAEVAQKKAEGKPYTLRFRIPSGQRLRFEDWVKGLQSFQSKVIGDFIIRRANGSAPFMYSNAIDDALMGVTHVLRGDDHLTNTPRQIWLLEALGLPVPHYGHISLILGDDGAPLSKRNGSQSVQSLREQGYLPIAVLNYLARLGHRYARDDWMSREVLASDFHIEGLSTSPARFDAQQLLHWQKEAVHRLDAESFWAWCAPTVQDRVADAQQAAFIEMVHGNVVFPADVLAWAEILCQPFVIHPEHPACASLAEMPAALMGIAQTAVQNHGADFKALTTALKEAAGVKGKALFMPLRLALTGRTDGPELAKMVAFLGADALCARFSAAAKHMASS